MASNFMVSKALDIIANKLNVVFSKSNNGFKFKKVSDELFGFVSEKVVYVVEFKDNKINLMEGNICKDSGEEDGKNDSFLVLDSSLLVENARIISQWFFDPESNTEKDAEDIANDFAETFVGSKKNSSHKIEKSKNEKDGLHFFLNRLITLFPELKEEAMLEKKMYIKFRYITFIKTCFVPLFLDVVNSNREDKLKKVINVLNGFYKDGNMDVRSTITIVILNSLNDEGHKKVIGLLNDELKEGFTSAYKIKGKTIKPEKLKKTLMSRLLAMSDKTPK